MYTKKRLVLILCKFKVIYWTSPTLILGKQVPPNTFSTCLDIFGVAYVKSIIESESPLTVGSRPLFATIRFFLKTNSQMIFAPL